MTNKNQSDSGTIEISIELPRDVHELLIAELADLGFVAFQDSGTRLLAYCPVEAFGENTRRFLRRWLSRQRLDDSFTETLLAPRNWNAEWERSIQPVRAGTFLILPERFREDRDIPEGTIPLWIDPKMSFGTGHHETTRLVLRTLPDLCRTGDRVLDIGTGTGVLAIAAAKLGAAVVDACDIDSWAAENAVENFVANRVDSVVRFFPGSIEHVAPSSYDVVVANIQFNVLHAMLPEILARTNPGGRVILSGVLRADAPRMYARASGLGFVVVKSTVEGDWEAIVLRTPE